MNSLLSLKTYPKTELRDLKDSLVKDLIICGVNDNLREWFIREDDLKLPEVFKIVQAVEQTRIHARELQEEFKGVSQIKNREADPPGPSGMRRNKLIANCRFCGRSH